MTADITRLFTDRDTRYHTLVRQQGRLPIDAEENFAADIAEWERDDAFVETIAPCGTPNDGFRITVPVAGPPADFTIAAGSYYLGGLRIENPAALTYRNQRGRNWLGFPMDAEGANEAIGNARQFLVWLDAIDQTVTASQDAELRDPGIGVPDGAAARRVGWRVRATPVAGPNCVLARQQWLAARGWAGRVDDTGALRSDATLTVGFNPADVDQDLCSPALTPGFLGARNECYRVMVSRPGRYVWGRDDAAPVYRVKLEQVGGQLRKISFIDQPRDEHVRPRAGQTIELLRWDQLLPNRQKTAETIGTFHTVATGYADKAITLAANVDAALANWLAGLPAAVIGDEDPADARRYFYLRVWSGGGRNNQPDNALADGDLAGTGLRLAFAGTPFAGDSWVVGARPNAPTQLLPWALRTGMAPHAPRRHVAPLAFVDLDAGTVIDCRRRFRALYKQGGCCTVTVGDEQSSWGDVNTIAAALALLPPSGGEICLGPGTWREHVVIDGRRDIIITGCGARTRWLAADPAQPLLTMTGVERIKVRRVAMESGNAPCIVIGPGPNGGPSRDVTIEDAQLSTPSGGVVKASAMDGLVVERCAVTSGPMADPNAANAAFAALTIQGDRLAIRHSRVLAASGNTAQAVPLGGIHVRGDSRDVAITDNVIRDGAGNGITLGSVRIVTVPAAAFAADPGEALVDEIKNAGPSLFTGFTVTIDDAGCIHIGDQDPGPTDDPADDTVDVPISDGAVYRLLIARNRIAHCGANGIATFPLLPVDRDGEPAYDSIAVERALIACNEIEENVRREAAQLPPLQQLFAGQGGIVLSTAIDVAVRDNEIVGNGLEPSRVASGLFVGYGEALRVERNRIERNGNLAAALPASCGGIVIRAAMGGAPASERYGGTEPDRPALLVQNNIVHSPMGRALKALAWGPVIVTGNRLTGANPSSLFANPLQAIILFLLGLQTAQDVFASSGNPEVGDLLLFDAALDAMGGDAVNLVNLSLTEELLLAYRIKQAGANLTTGAGLAAGSAGLGFSPGEFRGGETLFSDNQVSLRAGPANPAAHFTSILIVTLDDLGFADNQCEAEADNAFLLADALLIGMTLRVSANRFQEPVLCFASLVSAGVALNDTTHNQGTFGITASCFNPAKLVDTPNTSMI
jgi:hypothetical protein